MFGIQQEQLLRTSLASNRHMLRGHLAQDTDGNSWSGEGMSHDKVLVDTHLTAHIAHFMLEALSQGLGIVSDNTAKL
jgi:hypothetical protein